MSLRDKIDISEVFVVIGTENYVRSLRDPGDPEHHAITEQVITARHFCKPIILLIDEVLDRKDKDYLRCYFKNFSVIGELPVNCVDNESIKEAVTRMIELLGRCQ